MEAGWLTWVIQGVVGLAISALTYFLKRYINQSEQDMKQLQTDYSTSIKEMTSAFGDAIREANTEIKKVDDKVNALIQALPLQYTLREDTLRMNARVEQKLDKIIDSMKAGGKDD